MKPEYLFVVLLILILSNFGFWIYPRKKNVPDLKASLKALALATWVFLGIDLFAIGWFYKFNPIYVIGLNFGNIPLEEVLFFPIVGWGILLLHVNLKRVIFNTNWWYRLVLGLGIGFSVVNHWWYTVCVLAMMVFVKRIYVLTAGLTIVLTTIFNWYLTARPIVIYEVTIKSGLQIGPIPIEDYIFGLGYIFLVIGLYELSDRRRGQEAQ